MESPIPDRLWTLLLNVGVSAVSAAVTWSLWSQRRHALMAHAAEFADIDNPAKDRQTIDTALDVLRSRLVDEARGPSGMTNVECSGRLPALLRCLDRSVAATPLALSTAELVLRVISRTCLDVNGRRAFARSQGLSSLLRCLSDAHRSGHRTLVEEAAQTLAIVVRTADETPFGDVPPGSEVTLQLARHSAAAKLLRMLRPDNPPVLLQAVGAVVCSVSILRDGARVVAAGVDNRPGLQILRPLLAHANGAVLEQTLRTIAAVARSGADEEGMSDPAMVRDVLSFLNTPSQVRLSMGAVYVLSCALRSGHTDAFAQALVDSPGAFDALITQWCRSSEGRVRDLAESVVRRLERHPVARAAMLDVLRGMRPAIAEREAQDEAQRRQAMAKQSRQHAMMQQMMMMQGGDDE